MITTDDDKICQDFIPNKARYTRGIHPIIKQKMAKNQIKKQVIDEDIIDWISTQDNATQQYINGMIRNYMQFKNSAVA